MSSIGAIQRTIRSKTLYLLLSKITGKKELLRFTALNYIDKGIIFLTPFVVLYVFKDKTIYNDIEYIFSASAVLLTISELGVRNYFLYAYKGAADREALVREGEANFLTLFFIYFLLSAVSLAAWAFFSKDPKGMVFLIIPRTLYSFMISFYSVYFILKDTPSKIFIPSYFVNILTLATILTVKVLNARLNLFYFFSSQLLVDALLFGYIIRNRELVNFKRLFLYLGKTLAYAWPIILNIFLFMVINNYGRIYAYKLLSREEMFQISFVQRISLVVQLTHASASAYLSKRLFIDLSNKINMRLFGLYGSMLAISVLGAISVLVLLRWIRPEESVGLNISSFLILVYTVLWCVSSFFELYLNKRNKNRYIPLTTLISVGIFFMGLRLLGNTLFAVSASMALSMACSLSIYLMLLYKLGKEDHV